MRFAQRLADSGLRATHAQREVVYDVLLEEARSPPRPTRFLRASSPSCPTISSLATVYNCLETLVQ